MPVFLADVYTKRAATDFDPADRWLRVAVCITSHRDRLTDQALVSWRRSHDEIRQIYNRITPTDNLCV